MKRLPALGLSVVLFFSLSACAAKLDVDSASQNFLVSELPLLSDHLEAEKESIEIKVGDNLFHATLYEKRSAKAFSERLPLTFTMQELNGNEKYWFFSDSLPSDSTQIDVIQTGDLMLYGNDCIAFFYEDHSTSYRYTPFGRLEDAAGLSDALGNGNVTVTFSVLN